MAQPGAALANSLAQTYQALTEDIQDRSNEAVQQAVGPAVQQAVQAVVQQAAQQATQQAVQAVQQTFQQAVTQALQAALQPVRQQLERMEQRLERVEQRLERVEQRLERVEQRLERMDFNMPRRITNSHAGQDSTLCWLQNGNGQLPTAAPTTIARLSAASTPTVEPLLDFYGLAMDGDLAAKRARLIRHLGVL